MPGHGCEEVMALLNHVSAVPLILNDGHEVLERLRAGGKIVDIVEDLNAKFGQPELAPAIRQVAEGWDQVHLEAVENMLQWALGKLDTEDRILIDWKGDADHPEVVTRFELRGRRLLVEFAHPAFAQAASAVA